MALRGMQVFGCEIFLSYGMTECCGKISMSILPEDVSGLTGKTTLRALCQDIDALLLMQQRSAMNLQRHPRNDDHSLTIAVFSAIATPHPKSELWAHAGTPSTDCMH
jgi:hypothetical protein